MARVAAEDPAARALAQRRLVLGEDAVEVDAEDARHDARRDVLVLLVVRLGDRERAVGEARGRASVAALRASRARATRPGGLPTGGCGDGPEPRSRPPQRCCHSRQPSK